MIKKVSPDSAKFTTVKKLVKLYQRRIISILYALFFHPAGARKYACNKSSKSVTLVFYRISIIMGFAESGIIKKWEPWFGHKAIVNLFIELDYLFIVSSETCFLQLFWNVILWFKNMYRCISYQNLIRLARFMR